MKNSQLTCGDVIILGQIFDRGELTCISGSAGKQFSCYTTPLAQNLTSVLARLRGPRGVDPVFLETLTGAVCQHTNVPARPRPGSFPDGHLEHAPFVPGSQQAGQARHPAQRNASSARDLSIRPIRRAVYGQLSTGHIKTVNSTLIAANADQLKTQRKGSPTIYTSKAELGEPNVIVTTDKFEFDDVQNDFKLQWSRWTTRRLG